MKFQYRKTKKKKKKTQQKKKRALTEFRKLESKLIMAEEKVLQNGFDVGERIDDLVIRYYRLLNDVSKYYANKNEIHDDTKYFGLMTKELMNYFMFLYKVRACPINKQLKICGFNKKVDISLNRKVNNKSEWFLIDGCFDHHSNGFMRRNDTMDGNEPCLMAKVFTWNIYERLFHPESYKKYLCKDYDKNGLCQRGLICPYYHSNRDRRYANESNRLTIKDTEICKRSLAPVTYCNWMSLMIEIREIEDKIKYVKKNRGW